MGKYLVTHIYTDFETGRFEREIVEVLDKQKSQKADGLVYGEKIKAPFVWMAYQDHMPLFPELTPSSVTRLIYLSTFLDNDGRIVFGKGNASLEVDTLAEKLFLNRKQTQKFVDELKYHNLLDISDGAYSITQSRFKKGNIIKSFEQCIRLFVTPIRSFYSGISWRSHTGAANIFYLIPYLNWQYNIACENTNSKKLDRIQPYSFTRLANAMGKEINAYAHVAGLFEKYQYKYGGSRKQIVLVDKNNERSQSNKEEFHVIVNPMFFYGGTSFTDAKRFFNEHC